MKSRHGRQYTENDSVSDSPIRFFVTQIQVANWIIVSQIEIKTNERKIRFRWLKISNWKGCNWLLYSQLQVLNATELPPTYYAHTLSVPMLRASLYLCTSKWASERKQLFWFPLQKCSILFISVSSNSWLLCMRACARTSTRKERKSL